MHRYMTSPSHCQEPIYEWKYSKHTQCNPSISPHSIPPKQACNSLSPRTKIDLEFHFPLFYMNYERYSRRIYFLTDTAHVSEFRLLLVFPSKSYKLASIWHRIHVCRLECVESIATGRKSISFRVAIFFSRNPNASKNRFRVSDNVTGYCITVLATTWLWRDLRDAPISGLRIAVRRRSISLYVGSVYANEPYARLPLYFRVFTTHDAIRCTKSMDNCLLWRCAVYSSERIKSK